MATKPDDLVPCTCFLGKIDLHTAVIDSLREGAAMAFLGKTDGDVDVVVTVVAGHPVRAHIQGHDWLVREFNRNPTAFFRMIGLDQKPN